MSNFFRSLWRFAVPGWLQNGQGELALYTLTYMKDAMAERARQTLLAPLPSYGPEDALDLIGKDRAIPRGPFESADSYRPRLRAWRSPLGHRIRGSARALLEQLSFAFTGINHATIDARGMQWVVGELAPTRGEPWNWDGLPLSPRWARYWVTVQTTRLAAPRTIADLAAFTFTELAEATISGLPIEEFAAARTVASNGRLGWTPAGRKANTLVVYFPGQAYPAPDGTWDHWPDRDPQYLYEPLSRGIE